MGLKLITESNFNIDINEDSKKNLYVEGIFANAETKNQNDRVYPKSVLGREIDKIQENVKNRTLTGELNHPIDRAETVLDRAAILIEELNWSGNDVLGKAKVLSTPYGQIARSLLKDGVKIGISSRGLGSVSEGIVDENFSLLTWDLVQNPSCSSAWLDWKDGIYEGREFTLPNDIKDKHPTDEEVSEALEYHEKRIWQVLDSLRK